MVDWAGRRVACLGECMVELRTRPDGLLARAFGGDTLNTAVYLARLGVPVDYVTALGDDDFSADMLRAWEAEGVGTRHVRRIPGCLPGLYVIETDAAGERRFLYWRDSAPVRRLFDEAHGEETAAALSDAGVVYLSGITLSLFAGPARARLFAVWRPSGRGCRNSLRHEFSSAGLAGSGRGAGGLRADAGLERSRARRLRGYRGAHRGGRAGGGLRVARPAGVAEAVVKLAQPGCLVRIGGGWRRCRYPRRSHPSTPPPRATASPPATLPGASRGAIPRPRRGRGTAWRGRSSHTRGDHSAGGDASLVDRNLVPSPCGEG